MLNQALIFGVLASTAQLARASVPRYAQKISPISFAVLDTVPTGTQFNGTSHFIPPGTTSDSLKAKPFHIYDDSFYDIIGSDPTLTLLAYTATDPIFHEAVVWHPETNSVYFAQNAGPVAAGTGLNKSAIVQKIYLDDAERIVKQGNGSGYVNVTTVDSGVRVINPNGGTNFRGKIVYTAEGQGNDIPPALYLIDPNNHDNTTVIMNNFYGRQFDSLNDVAVNPRNHELYFTDGPFGWVQAFRPNPVLPTQVYRFNYDTGVVRAVADGFHMTNGITFSPDGMYAYVTDSGVSSGFWGYNYTNPSTIYRYDVNDEGNFSNRQLFAYNEIRVPDGIHCDVHGNVYVGTGDGINVYNPSGLLIGRLYLGTTSANFAFTGKGKMVVCAETKLWYVNWNAEGADITSNAYSG
ncbi:uncharacterized protein IL334_000596 [Kwoniella shivajii]|uniref:SMP-30/Gluconolactonase/LRE-like region domain-containing protein n=1 Tax=Kwoniella shivajii TaxID=564305 RepID=A0ABZ1CQ29_9TREE|nr:hypothetical protein IL334_000596 [Kwoniella shivajii]